MVVVLGKGGRRIPKERALEHVFGYAAGNEISVREFQFKSPQWTVGKNFDGTGTWGPCVVTADELPAGASGLRVETRLNGTTVQSASTADMLFDVATVISTVSQALTLQAGDIIFSGTPAGVGFGRTPKLYMKDGDTVEVEIERIGLLRNTIRDEPRSA
jgi:2-keto-4-pentenoate hydratase/2-oxohepta-3-ene-1,7-dioic acid hydratase in catechol pathway